MTTPVSFNEQSLRRFEDEEVIWLITVRADGQPQSSPVWFVWDETSFLIYSQPNRGKLYNLAANPAVGLHLDGGVEDGTTTIIEGTAQVTDEPGADERSDFTEKYREAIARGPWTPAEFAAEYSVPIRVLPHRVRAW